MSNDYIETIPLMREGWLGKQKKQSGNTTLHSNWDWTQEGLYTIIGETTAIDLFHFMCITWIMISCSWIAYKSLALSNTSIQRRDSSNQKRYT